MDFNGDNADMNSTHVSVGVGATTATAWLTTLLTGWHGLDGDHAAAMAGLITLGGGALIAIVGRIVQHNWPWMLGSQPAGANQ